MKRSCEKDVDTRLSDRRSASLGPISKKIRASACSNVETKVKRKKNHLGSDMNNATYDTATGKYEVDLRDIPSIDRFEEKKKETLDAGICHSYQDYSSLLKCSLNFYDGPITISLDGVIRKPNMAHKAVEPKTIVSCPSSNASDGNETPCRLPAKLQSPSDDKCLNIYSRSSEHKQLFTSISSPMKQREKILTLEEALDYTESASLIIESSSSMVIVHANAAFYHLTGMSASNDSRETVVDNSLADFVETKVSDHSTQPTFSIRDNSFELSSYPIRRTGKITHFCLKLEKISVASPENSEFVVG